MVSFIAWIKKYQAHFCWHHWRYKWYFLWYFKHDILWWRRDGIVNLLPPQVGNVWFSLCLTVPCCHLGLWPTINKHTRILHYNAGTARIKNSLPVCHSKNDTGFVKRKYLLKTKYYEKDPWLILLCLKFPNFKYSCIAVKSQQTHW